MTSAQRRTRRVTVYLSPETFEKLEALAERNGNITHSSVVSVAIAHMFRNDGQQPNKAKPMRVGESS